MPFSQGAYSISLQTSLMNLSTELPVAAGSMLCGSSILGCWNDIHQRIESQMFVINTDIEWQEVCILKCKCYALILLI